MRAEHHIQKPPVAAGLLLLATACTSPNQSPPTHQTAHGPSVLWVSLDTVRADHLALYGGRAASPTLEALAAQGLVFDQAISHFPETQFSHWAMLTGVLPETHGNVPGAGDSAYTGPTAAELAAGAGYATAAFIGGVTLKNEGCGLARGFRLYDDGFEPDPLTHARPVAEITAAAQAWIGTQQGPWLAFVHAFDAHFPYTPAWPDRYDPDYDGPLDGTDATLASHRDFGEPLDSRGLEHVVALYDAELTELDAALAPLLAALPADTIVVVTSDHGESFGHGYLFNHRAVLYDSVLHVPLVIRAPGLDPGRVPHQVGLVDLLPTVATAAGWTIPDSIHGRTLVTRGQDGLLTLAPVSLEPLWARTDPWLPGPLLAVRTASDKVIWDQAGQAQAFELDKDPGELSAGPPPAALAEVQDDYGALLEAMAPYRKERPPRHQPLDPGQRLRLEALGYLPPGPPPPGGPPPAGKPSGHAAPANTPVP